MEKINAQITEFSKHWIYLQKVSSELLDGCFSSLTSKVLKENPMVEALHSFLVTQSKAEYRILVIGSYFLLFSVVLIYSIGDTSAGKSTMINALLGVEILPTDPSECTAIFTEVAFADEFSMLYFDKENILRQYDRFENEHQLISAVKQAVEIDREQVSSWYRVRILLPLPILEVCCITYRDYILNS